MTPLTIPTHPGEVLAKLYRSPPGMRADTLAKNLDAPGHGSNGW